MRRNIARRFLKFKPPVILSCVSAVIFSGASVMIAARYDDYAKVLPAAIICIIYTCAALSLSLAVWAVVRAAIASNAKKKLLLSIHKVPLASKLIDDYAFRTVTTASVSFVMNALLAVSKGIAGWISGSVWLITFTIYYIVLCVAKLFLLRDSRRLPGISNETERIYREWKSYRFCGMLLIFLTVVLQGVVVLIVRDGNHFTYYGVVIFAVAVYDFYCLSAAIVYMIKTRKKHSPTIVAIKSISLATSLVSMLSLQTAMFASFGSDDQLEMQNLLNQLTGSAVCIFLLILGIVMVVQANKNIKNAGEW